MNRPASLRWSSLAAVLAVSLAGCERGPEPEAGPATSQAEPRRIPLEIEYGETVEQTLDDGECRLVALELPADRYLELAVEQHGVDVATTLAPPDGSEEIVFDAPVGDAYPEIGAFVTEAPGRYRLDVCSSRSSAADARFALRIEGPREPTGEQLSLARALRSYSRGGRWLGSGDVDTAEAEYTRALEAARAAGARRLEGWTLFKLAVVAERRERYDEEASRLEASADVHADLGEPRQEAFVLSFLGIAYTRLGRLREALAAHGRCLQRAEEAEAQGLTLRALGNLARVHEQLGYTLEAVRLYRRRRELARAVGDHGAEVHALTRLAAINLHSGRNAPALRLLEETLVLARGHGLDAQVVEILEDLGRARLQAGEPRKAAAHFEEALERRERGEADPAEIAAIRNNLGRCHRRLGEWKQASDLFHQALATARRSEIDPTFEGFVYLNLASLDLDQGNLDGALGSCRRALSILREHEQPRFAPAAHRCLAKVYLERGELESGLVEIGAAVELLETYRSRSALEELRAHVLADHLPYYELYVDLLLQRAEREPDAGHAARAFEVAERSKGRTLLDDLNRTQAALRERADPALVAREAELQEAMSELERQLLAYRLGSVPGEETPELDRRLKELREEHAVVVARILAELPGWSALLATEPFAVADIQAELLADPDTRLVSYFLGEETSHAWIVGGDSVVVETLPPREEIETLALAAARQLAASHQPHLRLQAELAAEHLSEAVWLPLVPHLDGSEVILVKDGALHHVPFAALPVPAEEPGSSGVRTVDRFELLEVPSASAAVALRRRHADRPPARSEVAVLSDPVFEADDDRLQGKEAPEAKAGSGGAAEASLSRRVRSVGLGEITRLTGLRKEAREIAALVDPEHLMIATGFDANRELLLGGTLEDFRVLHLAGHGLAHADLTGLLLSLYDRRGRPVDGLVQPYELYGLRLSADLVVLSACRTAMGQEVRGEGLMGLSRGFLHAGASQVLASLWDVDDEATVELMRRFYRAYLVDGLAPSRALRIAQRAMARDPRWAAPHYWSGFVLQGAGA